MPRYMVIGEPYLLGLVVWVLWSQLVLIATESLTLLRAQWCVCETPNLKSELVKFL